MSPKKPAGRQHQTAGRGSGEGLGEISLLHRAKILWREAMRESKMEHQQLHVGVQLLNGR